MTWDELPKIDLTQWPLDEIGRLEAEVSALRAERDEARAELAGVRERAESAIRSGLEFQGRMREELIEAPLRARHAELVRLVCAYFDALDARLTARATKMEYLDESIHLANASSALRAAVSPGEGKGDGG